jgi:hypothetical protein
MAATRSCQFTPVRWSRPWFEVTASGRIHRVLLVQRVDWGDGQPWLSIKFRCHGLATEATGRWLTVPEPAAACCRRCLVGQGGSRPSHSTDDASGLLPFDLEDELGQP